MKQYSLYAMGNAVVDIEIKVPESFLQTIRIEKGVMTLVDGPRQREVVAQVRKFGLPQTKHCGGSAANSAYAAACLGSKIFFNGKVADDELGRFYLDDLASSRIDTNAASSGGDTARCLVMVTPDAERTMSTYLGICLDFSVQDIAGEELAASDALYIEGYLASAEKGLDAAVEARRRALAAGVKTIISLSDPAMTKYFAEQLREILSVGKIHLLFCNAEEARTFTGVDDLAAALPALSALSENIAITLGERGALLQHGKESWTVPAPRVEAVDTNGAGDLFAGVYLHALSEGAAPPRAGELACLAASRLVSHNAPRLPLSRMAEFGKDLR